MINRFKHRGLEQFFTDGSKAGIRPEHAPRLRLVLARLHAARAPKDMDLPGLGLHPLHGKLKGVWSVSISANWRVVFQFEGPDVVGVDYLDYH